MKHLITCVAVIALSQTVVAEDKTTSLPAELNGADIAGAIFERPDMTQPQPEDGHVTLDVTSFVSSDQKFSSGMYKSGKTRLAVTEPYGG